MSVKPADGLHVEVLVSGLDLPRHAPSAVAVDHDDAVSPHTVCEVARGSIEDDDLDRPPGPFLDASGKVQSEAFECVRRIRFKQNRDIDIAVEALGTAGD